MAILGRRVDEREVTDAGERHLERARDRRRGERQHVDVRAPLLDPLLVLHAEPLLLVDDEQADVLERDVLRQQAMRRDDDVDRAVGQPLDDVVLFLGGEEPAEHLDAHGIVREALAERLPVLAREQRGRDEDRDLLAVEHRLGAARNATSVLP